MITLPTITGDGLDLGLSFGAALFGWLAWRSGSRTLRFLAGVVGATVLSGVLLFGFLAYPVLWGLSRRQPRHGYGWILALSVVGGTLLLARRLPVAELLPSATEHASGIVTDDRIRHAVWGWRRNAGQTVPQPYQEVGFDLDAPGGAVLHLRDRVDSGSVPALRVGARVDVVYPAGQPHAARLAAGGRTWAHAALRYMLQFTAALAVGMLLLAWITRPLRRRLDRVLYPGRGLARAASEGVPPESGRS